MKPALTPEEWDKWTARGGFRSLERTLDDPNELYVRDTKNGVLVLPDAHFEYGIRGRARHALAALALHGQPFSPASREVLTLLRDRLMSDVDDGNGRKYVCVWLTAEEDALLCTHAARIEALLPPEAK